jgi:hypothetical protein
MVGNPFRKGGWMMKARLLYLLVVGAAVAAAVAPFIR